MRAPRNRANQYLVIGIDPWQYLSDALTRLPSHSAERLGEPLEHDYRAAD